MHTIKVQPSLKEYQFSSFLEQQCKDHGDEEICLDLSFYRLSSSSVQDLKSFIQKRKVVELNCSWMNLDSSKVEALAETIKTHQYLKKIDFSHNNIQDNGAIALAQVLKSKPFLSIDARFNKIGPSGGEALVKSWVEGRRVTEIDLSNNLLGNEGARKVALVLKSNPGKISTIILRNNYITFQGDKDLALETPEHIHIFHRVKTLSFGEYLEKNPFMIFVLLIFFPLIVCIPFWKLEQDIEGCEHPRKGHLKNHYSLVAPEHSYSIDFFALKRSSI